MFGPRPRFSGTDDFCAPTRSSEFGQPGLRGGLRLSSRSGFCSQRQGSPAPELRPSGTGCSQKPLPLALGEPLVKPLMGNVDRVRNVHLDDGRVEDRTDPEGYRS